MQPFAEICDGLDSDCNGAVDNGNPAGGVACNSSKPDIRAAGTTAAARALSSVTSPQRAIGAREGQDEALSGPAGGFGSFLDCAGYPPVPNEQRHLGQALR
jgi:hypothetical protein